MNTLRMVQGKKKDFSLEIRDAAGGLVDLTGKTLRWSAKKNYADADPAVISKTSGAGIVHNANQPTTGKGLATLTITSADTTGIAGLADDIMHTLVTLLEMIQGGGDPEALDSGLITLDPAVRVSV